MPTDQITTLIQEWERAKLGAAEFIDAMPDDKLDFRPSPDIFSFAGQFLHIADANYLFACPVFGAENPFAGQKSETIPVLQTKSGLKEFTLASYDFVTNGLKALDPATIDEEVKFFKSTMSRRLILAKAIEHHAHHRGQTVIYFRIQGLKPPSERLF
jgi:uncharacterized damage-inducible protein DinB